METAEITLMACHAYATFLGFYLITRRWSASEIGNFLYAPIVWNILKKMDEKLRNLLFIPGSTLI